MSEPGSEKINFPRSYSEECRARAKAYLHERGVLESTLIAHGGEIDPLVGRPTIAARLEQHIDGVYRDGAWNEVEAILWFKVFNFNDNAYWLARPLPRFGKSKFLATSGSNGVPWIPQATRDVAKDVGVPIVFTEGPIRALALIQAGAFPVGLMSVGMAATSKQKAAPALDLIESADEQVDDDGRLRLHGELDCNFQWARRRVYFCFDANRLKNKDVRQAEIRLAFLLRSAGADVFQLSTWPLAEGKGIDDFLAGKAGTDPEKQREAFAGLIEIAVPFIETLDRHDIDAAKGELHKQGDRAKFDELAKRVARQLGVSKASLGPFDDHQKDSSGAEAIEIPPTAEPWGQEVKADEVLDEICDTIRRFVWMKPSQCRAAALWVVLTYLHEAINILPILLVTSPEEECGKTTLLELIYNLCNRPIPASNISAAAIYRTIKNDCPTLILDEADTYLKEDEAMRGVINSGHKRAFAYVIRVISKRGDTGKFSTWCPKTIAMIGQPKRTIISRSIHIHLDRKREDAKTERLKDEHYEECEVLRRKISRLADDIRAQVKTFRSELLGNRAGDNWQPLFAIAEAAGEAWLKETVQAAQRISRIKSFGRYLLESLGRIITEKREKMNLAPTERIFLKSLDLVNELNQDNEAPWRDDKSDGGLTALQLSKALGAYDIKPEQVREAADRGRGYWSDGIENVIKTVCAQ